MNKFTSDTTSEELGGGVMPKKEYPLLHYTHFESPVASAQIGGQKGKKGRTYAIQGTIKSIKKPTLGLGERAPWG